jgi:hypothetical protein
MLGESHGVGRVSKHIPHLFSEKPNAPCHASYISVSASKAGTDLLSSKLRGRSGGNAGGGGSASTSGECAGPNVSGAESASREARVEKLVGPFLLPDLVCEAIAAAGSVRCCTLHEM